LVIGSLEVVQLHHVLEGQQALPVR
jgi:hypothetical protein